MDTQLSGLNALITGASGGIGRALASLLGGEGCGLALHANTQLDALGAWAAQQPWAARAHCGRADLREREQTFALVREARAALGRLDVCVINAGIWPADDVPLHRMSAERVREVIEINLLGAMWSAQAFIAALAEDGPREDGRGASVCFVGSTAGRFGEAGHAAYSVSKAALYGLVRSLKNEIVRVDPYARVNMVEPGWTATPMAEAGIAAPGAIERVAATMPLRQLARARDIASSVAYLSAPGLARHVSGEILTVAGGMEGRGLWSAAEIDADAVRARLRED